MPTTDLDFEARYRRDADPWGYRSSAYEQAKYQATLAACGPGPFASAVELGGSIGVFSRLLAPRCASLTTIDGSPTAVRIARAELAGCPGVAAVLASLPEGIPDGPHDLVVASEILYYLDAEVLARTLLRLEQTLAAGGRLVAVHWRPPGPERPFSAAQVHDLLRSFDWLAVVDERSTADYRLDVLERR